jgi:homogentisate 1,2-dioxygenase
MASAPYMSGFGNEFETEALPGALPIGQNSPQRCPYGLYAEQISGAAFTAPRGKNQRSWLYRIRPSVRHTARFKSVDLPHRQPAPSPQAERPIGPCRWNPVPIPDENLTFIEGVRTFTTAGDSDAQAGMSVGLYFVTASMRDDYFYNADGEMLIVPQQGALAFATEFGHIEISPGEICVLPRGVKFRVELRNGPARGYYCENYGQKFTLPHRGPIGANCLANPRDFKTPVAAFEDRDTPSRLTVKWCGRFYACDIGHSPLDVVAWHGNYAPYAYDLRRFAPVGALLFDHPDPSIFSVLSAPSEIEGVSDIDLVIFPERWQVAEHTFRPPWFHMNVMSEFMGLIFGRYDAKADGFQPGGASLHNCMLPHGPDAQAFERATQAQLEPQKLTDTLAFMFETRLPQHLTSFAASLPALQEDYADCWAGLEKRFNGQK